MNILKYYYKRKEIIYKLNKDMSDTNIEIIYMPCNSAKLPYSEIKPQVKNYTKRSKRLVKSPVQLSSWRIP